MGMLGSEQAPAPSAGTVNDAVPRVFLGGDGLRAIAALAVLVFHAAIATSLYKHAPSFFADDEHTGQFRAVAAGAAPLLALSRIGVFIFFVLSGYLLSRPFLASYIVGTPRPRIGRYAANRLLRIVPAFWVVMVVYLTWDHAWHAGGASGLLAALLFAQNYHFTGAAVLPQAWTLDIEMAFYALIPIVAVIALRLRRAGSRPGQRLALALGACALAFVASLLAWHSRGLLAHRDYTLAAYLFAFLPGVALAAIEPFVAPRLRAQATGRRWSRVALAVAALLLAANVYAPGQHHELRLILTALACGALVGATLALQWATGGCWRSLTTKPMRWVGERSYGVYLIHLGLMGHLLQRIGPEHGATITFVALTVSSLVATLVLADILWRVVERPALERRLPWRDAEFSTRARRGAA